MKRLLPLVGVGALAVTLPLVATAGKPKPRPAVARSATVPKLSFTKYKLRNGLEVILHVDKTLPLVAVNVWYHVGAVDETQGRTGFAHLFEHVMFQGSAHVGDDMHFRYLQLAGASAVNGTTGNDRTNYYQTLPANQLALGLWLESDRMGFLLDSLTQAKLDKQRLVVKNERRQSIDNQPYGKAREKMCQALYPNHPYGGCVIGTMDDLNAATLSDVKGFFRKYYTPANATLCLAGDFDPTQVKPLIEKYFGSLKGAAKPRRVAPKKPVHTRVQRFVLTDRVRFPKVTIGWITPSLYQPGDAELDLLSVILQHGKSSRLYKTLVYDKSIAQSVSAYQQSAAAGSAYKISAMAAAKHTAKEVEAALWKVLKKVARKGVTARELRRARTIIETQLFGSLQRVGARANTLQRYNLFAGDPGYLGKDLLRYRNATRQGVQAAARKLVQAKGYVVIHVEPRKGRTP